MIAKPSLGYKELNDSAFNITSVSTNNSPLLKRLQVNRIKHLLTVKSKIFPINKDITNESNAVPHALNTDYKSNCNDSGTRSLPASPVRSRLLSKHSISTNSTDHSYPNHINSNNNSNNVKQATEINYCNNDCILTSNSKFHLSEPNIPRKVRQRIKSVLSLPRYSLNSSTNKLNSLKAAVKNDGNVQKKEDNHIHIVNHNNENVIPIESPHAPPNQDGWPISYHPIDEIRDVILVRDHTRRFGIKLDRTSCGEQITYIVMILPGSVAQKSGLKVGDQIVRVDHFYVHQIGMENLVEYIRAKKESVRIFFKARSLLVRAKVVHIKKEDNKFGLRLIRRVQGVFVDYVIPNSAADRAQLKEGDQLLKINNVDVSHWSQERATHLLKHSTTQTLTLHVYDATFAANDCLHKKNIFFDCSDGGTASPASGLNTPTSDLLDASKIDTSDTMVAANAAASDAQTLQFSDVDCDWTDNSAFSLPNSPNRYIQMDWKNHC